MKNTLFIIRGLPGAGKTTLAKMLTPYNVAADDMPGLYTDGNYQIELQARSHEWCKERVESWLANNIPLIAVHNGFTVLSTIEPYFQLAQRYNYSVQVIHCEGIKLMDKYVESIHDVPKHIVDSRIFRWEPLRTIQK